MSDLTKVFGRFVTETHLSDVMRRSYNWCSGRQPADVSTETFFWLGEPARAMVSDDTY